MWSEKGRDLGFQRVDYLSLEAGGGAEMTVTAVRTKSISLRLW